MRLSSQSVDEQCSIGRKRYGNWVRRSPSDARILLPASTALHLQSLPKAPERIRVAWEALGYPRPLPAVVRRIADDLSLHPGTVERVLSQLPRPAAAPAGDALPKPVPTKAMKPTTNPQHRKPATLTEIQSLLWDEMVRRDLDPTVPPRGPLVAELAAAAGCSKSYVRLAQEAIIRQMDATKPRGTLADTFGAASSDPEPAPEPTPEPVATAPEPDPEPAPTAPETGVEPAAIPVPVRTAAPTPGVNGHHPQARRMVAMLFGGARLEPEPLPVDAKRRALRLAADCPEDLEPAEWARVLSAAADAALAVG